ncbi:hypothetical protein [Streptodolium elevatio]|uniref:Integral membrane protein n=1 Tax=Streptodolium elevatio TaxID=3157996 RepID=A0ABV3DRK0_9ACTN
MPSVSEGLQLLRAGVFAGVCVVLSAGGHVLASGSAVPGWAVLGAFAAAMFAGWAGSARECSGPRLAGAMGVGQFALHSWFSFAVAHAAGSGSAHGHGHEPGHRHGGPPAEPGSGTWMLAAHLAVAVAAAGWLRVGEAAVFRLLARWDARVRAGVGVLLGLRTVPARNLPRIGAVAVRPGVHRGLATRYDLARRGPPAGAFVR